MPLRILSPGLFSLPVGLPRPGQRALGVPPGGAADAFTFQLGNALIGNPPGTPALEITLLGPTLQADADTGCVVCGPPFAITCDGEPIAPNHTFTLRAGQVLKIGGTPRSCRGYLCVVGGFPLPTVPTPLAAGDVLTCAESRVRGRRIAWGAVASPTVLHTLPGPQRDWFPDDNFFTRVWTVGEASNRMGVRLVGEPIAKRAGELVSEPVAAGAVQVTHDGRPVVLGVDGQTIGGYPKVAHVVRADLDLLGRLRPGNAVRFVAVSAEVAEELNRAKWVELNRWLLRLSVGGATEFTKI
ncbi:MAG: biotin-dependent carboxyltransferase family protein [Fimbriiglobus sp.]|nr:biotin-dependent carboxyltransferase family protein [Fimbriiglobus sp.]